MSAHLGQMSVPIFARVGDKDIEIGTLTIPVEAGPVSES